MNQNILPAAKFATLNEEEREEEEQNRHHKTASYTYSSAYWNCDCCFICCDGRSCHNCDNCCRDCDCGKCDCGNCDCKGEALPILIIILLFGVLILIGYGIYWLIKYCKKKKEDEKKKETEIKKEIEIKEENKTKEEHEIQATSNIPTLNNLERV